MDKTKFSVTIKYIVLIIGLSITAIGIFTYSWFNSWVITIDSFVKLTGLGVGVTTAIYAAMNIRHISDAHRNNIKQKQKEFSIQLMSSWLDPEMTKTFLSANPMLDSIKNASSDDNALEIFNKDNAGRHSLIAILNFFELIASSIDNCVADEKILKDFFRGIVLTHYNLLNGIIDLRRKKSNNLRIYKKFESLVKKWS